MSDEQEAIQSAVRRLLDQGAETRNCDFKAPMIWPAKGDERAGLIKDFLAFSNTIDGGWIVVGVDKVTHEPVGLSAAQAATFDQSAIHEVLVRYGAPAPDFTVHRARLDGCLLVVIRIKEFADVPVVAREDFLEEALPRRRLIVRKAGLYIRTPGVQTVEIADESLIRELLGRSVRRSGDNLIRQFERVLGGRPPAEREVNSSPAAVRDAFESFADTAAMAEDGHWEFIIEPFKTTNLRVEELPGWLAAAQVNLRGWPFPAYRDVRPLDGGIEIAEDWKQYHSRAQFMTSGLFVMADILDARQDFGNRKVVSLLGLLFTFSELFEFATRLFGNDETVSHVRVAARITGLAGRQLQEGSGLWDPYTRPDFSREVTIAREVLTTQGPIEAVNWTYDLAFAMGNIGLLRANLEKSQEQLLAGRIFK